MLVTVFNDGEPDTISALKVIYLHVHGKKNIQKKQL